ncbi:MAG: hypothetical protein Q9209_006563 [Squamulea sp. 1 TL-2023]
MKFLIDKFGVLVVEWCILGDLADVLSPDTILGLSDDMRTTAELKTLQEEFVELNRFSRLRSAGNAEEESMIAPKNSTTSDGGSEDEKVYEPRTREIEQAIVLDERIEEPGIPVAPEPCLVLYEEAAVPVAGPSGDYGWGFGSTPKSKKAKKR